MPDGLTQVRREADDLAWTITGPDDDGQYSVYDESGWVVGLIVTTQTTRCGYDAYGAILAADPRTAASGWGGRSPVMRDSFHHAWRDLCAYNDEYRSEPAPDLCMVCGVDIGDAGVVREVRLDDGTVDDRLPFCATHAADGDDQDPDEMTATFNAVERLADKLIPDAAVLLSPDYQGMAVLLQLVRRAIAQLKWADEELTGELVKVLPGRETEVPGVGLLTLRTGTTRKQWDKDGLVAAVTARIADVPDLFIDADTGEFVAPHEVAHRVIGAFLEVGTPSWKTTGLRALRLDPDEYCEVSYGAKSVQMPALPPFAGRVVEGAGE